MTLEKRISDFSADEKSKIYIAYQRRFDQLNALGVSNAEGALQYLLAVNGGGAAAMLGIVGAVQIWRDQLWPYVVLGIFVAGLIFVGVARICLLVKMASLLSNFRKETTLFYNGEIDYSDFLKRDQSRVDTLRWIPWVFGWLSLSFFVIGCVSAAWLFATRAPTP